MTNIIICGATGLIGTTLLNIIYTNKFMYENLYLVATHKNKNKCIHVGSKSHHVITFQDSLDLNDINFIFMY